MEIINLNAVFNRKNKLNSKGFALIHIRANYKGKSIYFSTNISIKPENWNDKTRKIKSNNSHYVTLNLEIEKLKTELQNLAISIATKQVISLELLKETFENKNKSIDFIDFVESEINKSNVEYSTLNNYKNVLTDLRNFKKTILFNELDYNLIEKFNRYLFENQNNKKNTIAKKMTIIKKFIHLAINKDLLEYAKNPFLKYKVEREESQRKFYNKSEFEKIITFVLPENHVYRELFDIYLFALYSGLRSSDLKDLKKTDIYINMSGYYIDKQMIKTKKQVQTPIDSIYKAIDIETPKENTPQSIIKRNIEKSKTLNLFNNKLNILTLERLTKIIGVKRAGFHAARHTIAMYLLNEKQLGIDAVSNLLGHSDLKSTQVYSRMTLDGLTKRLQMVYNKNESKKEQTENKKAM